MLTLDEESREICFPLVKKAEKNNYKPFNYGGVAQLGEHLPCKQGVMGSNPIISTSPEGRAANCSSEIQSLLTNHIGS